MFPDFSRAGRAAAVVCAIAVLTSLTPVGLPPEPAANGLDYGQYYGYLDDASLVGAAALNPHDPYFGRMRPDAVKAPHGHFQHVAPADPGDDFPYSEFKDYNAKEVAAGKPPLLVAATFAGKKRPVFFSWPLELDASLRPRFNRSFGQATNGLSRLGAWFGIAVAAGVLVYLVSKLVRLRRLFRNYRTHRMTPGELKRRMEADEPLIVVDLRNDVERLEGSIPGSLAAAYRDLDSLLPAIGNKEVVFYCSCPDELTSVRAVLRLNRHGLTNLHALPGGFSGWRGLGLPVDGPVSRAVSA